MSLRDSFRSFETNALRPAFGVFKGGARRRKELAQLGERIEWLERRIVELERTIQESIGLQLSTLDDRSGDRRPDDVDSPRA